MDRQAILTNFVKATHGKGRAVTSDEDLADQTCLYFPEDHPGCAIGCQPGFRERFKSRIEDSAPIKDLLNNRTRVSRELREFFDIERGGDVDFLRDLQEFHDSESSWDLPLDPDAPERMTLRTACLKDFCESQDLRIPKTVA